MHVQLKQCILKFSWEVNTLAASSVHCSIVTLVMTPQLDQVCHGENTLELITGNYTHSLLLLQQGEKWDQHHKLIQQFLLE